MSDEPKKKNYGKEFERQIYTAAKKVPDVSIDRIPDQVTKYRGSSSNICDFVAYKKPHIYYLECKTVHGNTLPFSNIRENQWNGLLEKSKIPGVIAGVLCWWVDKDVTLFLSIQTLNQMANWNYGEIKSVRYDILQSLTYKDQIQTYDEIGIVEITGTKKRVLFDYNLENFFDRC